MAIKEQNYLKTFSIHEKNKQTVNEFKQLVLQYKHLENILNLLLAFEFNLNFKTNNNIKEKSQHWTIFNLLRNKIIMKAVLKSNTGGAKTSTNIKIINDYFDSNHPNHLLFKQAKAACLNLNDKNVGEIVGRLHKDWQNFFLANKTYCEAKDKKGLQKPSYPKPKSLNKVFNYSVPLEVSKFSMSKEHLGLLGINLGTKMTYVKYYNYDKNKPNGNKPSYLNKNINSVTVSLSHGHIYYNLQYHAPKHNNKNEGFTDNLELMLKGVTQKVAGLDIGIHNIASIFINDEDTQSLIISGKELISYNCNYNKKLAKNAMDIASEVTSYKTIIKDDGKNYQIPEKYSHKGKILQTRRSQIFERRSLFMEDYLHKLSKKITNYLVLNKVTKLVISRNLSFTKTTGEIEMRKASKQKFYQIPFGRMLNLLESKLLEEGVEVVLINEAYTSKTSSLTADVVNVQGKAKVKEVILPTDLNGSRGNKKKGVLNNPLGRGLFKDNVINKIINADLNAAANHIKVGIVGIEINRSLSKYNNPVKIKSNNEFDKLLANLANN